MIREREGERDTEKYMVCVVGGEGDALTENKGEPCDLWSAILARGRSMHPGSSGHEHSQMFSGFPVQPLPASSILYAHSGLKIASALALLPAD